MKKSNSILSLTRMKISNSMSDLKSPKTTTAVTGTPTTQNNNPLQQLQKLPNLVKNITDSIFWIAQKNILMTKNVLLERLDTIINQSIFEGSAGTGTGSAPSSNTSNTANDSNLDGQIENIYQLRDTYINLNQSLSNVIAKNVLISNTRHEIGLVLKSDQFQKSCNTLEKLGKEAGDVFSNLGSLLSKYNEKLDQLQKSIDTFISHAMQGTIDSIERHRSIFNKLKMQRSLLVDLSQAKSSETSMEKVRQEVENLLRDYQKASTDLFDKMNMLNLASQGLLTDAFEKYVDDMVHFYDNVNEEFEKKLPSIVLT